MMHRLYIECPFPYTFIMMRRTCASFRLHWNNCREKPLGGIVVESVISKSSPRPLGRNGVVKFFFMLLWTVPKIFIGVRQKCIFLFVCLPAHKLEGKEAGTTFSIGPSTIHHHHLSPPPCPGSPSHPRVLTRSLCTAAVLFVSAFKQQILQWLQQNLSFQPPSW